MTRSFVLSAYAKSVVAFIVGGVVFVGGLLTDGVFNSQDVIALAGWIGGTFGVYQVPNRSTEIRG